MSRGIGIIDPTIGASEYGANLAQWDWKPFSDAMSAAKTTYGMVQGNKEEKRKEEEMAMEKLLFPSKQKKAELEWKLLQAEIKKTDALTDHYLGKGDADFLLGSSFGGEALKTVYGSLFGNDSFYGFGGGNAAPVKQEFGGSGFGNISSARYDGK